MYSLFFSILLLLSLPLLAEPHKVLVSIAPQKFLVEKIAGESAQVQVLVPQNMSSHSYEPTMKQMIEAKSAKAWFCIGEGFETQLYDTFGTSMTLIDARKDLPLLHSSCTNCSACAFDPHIWLSCPLLKIQAQQIATYFSEVMPENRTLYQTNLRILTQEIDELDATITTLMQGHEGKAILVSHPAFGYFCHDYHLVQLPVEVNGKEPSPKQITSLIKQAKEANVTTIFTQIQYPLKGALRIQDALQIKLHQINPYEENVLTNLKYIAEAFIAHD